mmetsp:Transcript_120895/g.376506  ORF Transcript_120895/g.376506 Transcript_120895/m.376506 type:complete len:357 (-) Transcript_120895:3-1073(-)
MISSCPRVPYLACFSSSPDGVNWTRHSGGRAIYGRWTDTMSCLSHDRPGPEYEMVTRWEPYNPRVDGRGIRGVILLNGTLTEVLQSVNTPVEWKPDEQAKFILDKEFGYAEMFRRQAYSLTRTLLPDAGYLGILQVYNFVDRSREVVDQEAHLRMAKQLGLGEEFASVHLYLLPSQDGLHFDHSWVYADAPLLPEDLTDGFHLFSPASRVLTRDGHHWLYYDRSRGRHYERWNWPAEIAVARWREGRMVRLRPMEERGVVVTQSFLFDPGQELSLDLQSWNSTSHVTVELLLARDSDDGGLGLLSVAAYVEAMPLHGANGSAPVRWPKDGLAALSGRPVHLRFGLSATYLYGFVLS